MFSKFDDDAKKILLNMKKEMTDLKHPYVGTEHLLLSILKYGNNNLLKKLNNEGITYEIFKNELLKVVGKGTSTNEYFLYTPLLRRVMENASLISSDNGKNTIDVYDLITSLLNEGEGIAIRILLGMNLDLDKLYDLFVKDSSTIHGKLLVESFGINLNEKCKEGKIDPVVGREKEISRLIEILSRRTKNNPILLGEAGVGKTAVVEELARRLENRYLGKLSNKKIISISMSNLVAGTKYRGEFEERVEKIISELENNDDIILFIDEIHTLVGAGGAEGAIDASNILKPALARGKIKIIGATTTNEYKEFIEKDKALARRFQIIDIKEPKVNEVINILKKLRPIYEKYHMVKISDEVIEKIAVLSDKYIFDRKMPDKAIDVMDEACSRLLVSSFKNSELNNIDEKLKNIRNLKNDSILNNNFNDAFLYRKAEKLLETKKNKMELQRVRNKAREIKISDVYSIIEERAKVPISLNNNDISNNLRNRLRKKIFGQDEAIEKLVSSIRKKKYVIEENEKPNSFLFIGPTGVGKTLLAKEFGKFMYNDNVFKVDMSEFKENHSISKMIGSPPGYVGYNDNKNLFEKVKDNPYSLIILDEIEKGSKDVINLFLQILDEGKCKNSSGEEINFSNTTIIMTSNLGSKKNNIGFLDLNNNEDIKEFFGIEFINRIGSIIKFNSITKDVCNRVIKNRIKRIQKAYKAKNINISCSKELVQRIIKNTEYETFGLRRVNNVIEHEIESNLIDQMLNGVTDIVISN